MSTSARRFDDQPAVLKDVWTTLFFDVIETGVAVCLPIMAVQVDYNCISIQNDAVPMLAFTVEL